MYSLLISHSKRGRKTFRNTRRIRLYKYIKGCCNCGIKTNLTFHHKDKSQKISDVSTMLSKTSWGKIKIEIKKCAVMCRKCHDIIEGMNNGKQRSGKRSETMSSM